SQSFSGVTVWRQLRLSNAGQGFASLTRTLPGMLGEPLIVLGDLNHHGPRDGIAVLLCDQARCVGATTPVVGAVDHTMLRANVFITWAERIWLSHQLAPPLTRRVRGWSVHTCRRHQDRLSAMDVFGDVSARVCALSFRSITILGDAVRSSSHQRKPPIAVRIASIIAPSVAGSNGPIQGVRYNATNLSLCDVRFLSLCGVCCGTR